MHRPSLEALFSVLFVLKRERTRIDTVARAAYRAPYCVLVARKTRSLHYCSSIKACFFIPVHISRRYYCKRCVCLSCFGVFSAFFERDRGNLCRGAFAEILVKKMRSTIAKRDANLGKNLNFQIFNISKKKYLLFIEILIFFIGNLFMKFYIEILRKFCVRRLFFSWKS